MIGKLLKRGVGAARLAARVSKGMLTGPDGPGFGVAEFEDFEKIRAEAAAQDRAEGVMTAGSEMDAIAEGTVEISAEDLRVTMEIEEDTTLPLLIDVRQDHEWAGGHIESAIHVPLDQLGDRLAEIDRERLVVLYCHSGMRSIDGSYVLKREGYPRVRSLAGGIIGWREAGNQTVQP